MPGMYPKTVSNTLIQNCLPIPNLKATPKGGNRMASIISNIFMPGVIFLISFSKNEQIRLL